MLIHTYQQHRVATKRDRRTGRTTVLSYCCSCCCIERALWCSLQSKRKLICCLVGNFSSRSRKRLRFQRWLWLPDQESTASQSVERVHGQSLSSNERLEKLGCLMITIMLEQPSSIIMRPYWYYPMRLLWDFAVSHTHRLRQSSSSNFNLKLVEPTATTLSTSKTKIF